MATVGMWLEAHPVGVFVAFLVGFVLSHRWAVRLDRVRRGRWS